MVCTAFLLLLCLTGLPLIFHQEIEQWAEGGAAPAPAVQGGERPNLDVLILKAKAAYPGHVITSVALDPHTPRITINTGPSWPEAIADPSKRHYVSFDADSGAEITRSAATAERTSTFMDWMLRLHVDLFLSLPGQYFLAGMGVLFVAAIVSGVVLYGPYTRNLTFGVIRSDRSRRTRWLDIHNLIGVTALAWMLVVGSTGVMNGIEPLLFERFQRTHIQPMLNQEAMKEAPPQDELASLEGALHHIARRLPDMNITFVRYPGSPYGTPAHYFVWTEGRSPLTARLKTPVLVDARSGQITAILEMPRYYRMVQLSRPLHFGDYGGIPLKVIWALLDLMTITVLASGLYLWLARARRDRAERAGTSPPRLAWKAVE